VPNFRLLLDESFRKIILYQKMNHQMLHRCEQFNISRYCTVSIRTNNLHVYSPVTHTPLGPKAWPVRSPDIASLEYFLWRHVKDMVYRHKQQTRECLQRIMKPANRIDGNNKIIGQATNFLCDALHTELWRSFWIVICETKLKMGVLRYHLIKYYVLFHISK